MQRPALFSLASLALLLCGCPDGKDDTAGMNETTGVTSILPPTSSDPLDPTTTTTGPEPTTGSGSESVGESDSTTFDPSICEQFIPELDPVIPRVMLVLDKSGSMIFEGNTSEPGEPLDGYWDHDGDPATDEVTRWNSLHAVVESMVSGLDAVIHFGAVLFPSLKATGAFSLAACPVDPAPLVPIGPNAGAAILAALPSADNTTIAGGTPATAGVLVATSELASLQDDEPKFIVLVTDGAANCKQDLEPPGSFNEYDDQLPIAVADALAQGVPTYVIGIDIQDVTTPVVVDGTPDDVNTYEKLNELAEAGGTARPGDEKFYNATNQIELQAALMQIIGDTLSCEISLGGPLHPDLYIKRVEIGADDDPGQLVYTGFDDQVADCAAESGWQYTSDTREAIQLCGAACEHYKQTGVVVIDYGCGTA